MKALALLVVLTAGSAHAQVPPSPAAAQQSDPRLVTLAYDPSQVVKLKVATNYQTTIVFAPGEQVENVAIGDADAWQATLNNQSSALFLKPLRSSGVTNMTVITDARVYSFELTAAYTPAPDTPFAVRFTYPDVEQNTPARRLRALRPSAIEDDGVQTTIRWRSEQTLPAVFAVDDQGDEVLLAGQMRDGRYVIDAVHRALVFRLDGQSARAQRLRERPAR
ncbi:hypothetical protein LTR94_024051 [Friedmanniomyces endolithicus]|nr:hypothetical protein LTR94_024051 [Friedmanniomyces endolithicus]